jgi:hypothetical protein
VVVWSLWPYIHLISGHKGRNIWRHAHTYAHLHLHTPRTRRKYESDDREESRDLTYLSGASSLEPFAYNVQFVHNEGRAHRPATKLGSEKCFVEGLTACAD